MEAVNLHARQPSPEESRRRLGKLNELAARYCGAGRFAEAVPLFEDVVAGCRDSFGDEDPDTLISEGNLVVTLLRLDPRGPALLVLDAHVEARRRVLGSRHPATLAARHAQAAAHESAGHVDESVAMFATVLADRAQVLGPTHPDTVASRLGFGLATATAGDLPGATRMLDEALRDSDRVLGREHRLGTLLRVELEELNAELAEPETDADPPPTIPAPRRPRGARFPRRPPDQRAADPGEEQATTGPAAKPRRPRGARFRRRPDG